MTFKETKLAYQQFLTQNNLNQNKALRIETQVESMKDWSQTRSFKEILEWVHDHRRRFSMTIAEISLNDCREWKLDNINGSFQHKTGQFFSIQGLRVSNSETREVGVEGWDQTIVQETGFNGGIVGIMRKKIHMEKSLANF